MSPSKFVFQDVCRFLSLFSWRLSPFATGVAVQLIFTACAAFRLVSVASVAFEIVLLALSPFDLAFMACVALKLVLIVCVAFQNFYAIVFPSGFFSWRVICQDSSTFLACRVPS